MLEVADRALNRSGGFPAGPAHGVERPDRVQNRAADAQDGVRLERGRSFGFVSIDGAQQPQHAGLHGVFVIEEPRHRDAQAPDDVLDEVRVLVDQLVAGEAQNQRRRGAVSSVAAEIGRLFD